MSFQTKLRKRQPGDRRPLGSWLGELEHLPFERNGYTAEKIALVVGKSQGAVHDMLREFLQPVQYDGPYKVHIYSTEDLRELGKAYNAGFRYRAA